MEDGLVPIRQVAMGAAAVVLILIVVEDGLVPVRDNSIFHILHVLILIVVEDGLVHDKNKFIHKHSKLS